MRCKNNSPTLLLCKLKHVFNLYSSFSFPSSPRRRVNLGSGFDKRMKNKLGIQIRRPAIKRGLAN